MQLLTSSPCTQRRHSARARGGSKLHQCPAQPLVLPGAQVESQDRPARPGRCAGRGRACQGDTQRQSSSQGRRLQGSLDPAVSVLEICTGFSQPCKTFWMVLRWVCLSLTLNPDRGNGQGTPAVMPPITGEGTGPWATPNSHVPAAKVTARL